MPADPLRVTVWNENVHEQSNQLVRDIYPGGIHGAIAEGLAESLGTEGLVRTATLDEPEHGLTNAILAETDVLMWWGHLAHDRVEDTIVDRVQQRVLAGMGLVVLHSAHLSKIFCRLMGTSCVLRWREAGERERLWIVDPGHPIVAGLDEEYFELEHEEMYGELFDIPAPDELLLISWFEGGEVFRSGCTFRRGKGKIFYFRPGHETYPTYYDGYVRRILANGVRWATPSGAPYFSDAREIRDPLSPISG